MNKNILVGLIARSSAWGQVLEQEGVPHAVIDLRVQSDVEACSVLAINRTVALAEVATVENYLKHGGTVIGYASHLKGVAGIDCRSERLEYIVSDDHGPFGDIHLVDLALSGAIPTEANCLRTQDNIHAMFAGQLGGGHAVVLPFDVAEAISDHRSASKNFYARWDRLPHENVALISKGEVRYLVHRSLEYLHHRHGMPYAHLWFFPDSQKTLFAFRVDTDGGDENEIDAMYEIARAESIRMSWYLDVKSHERWLPQFTAMPGQEISLHCYDHQTHPTYDANMHNIAKAKRLMEAAGLVPGGFAAPYGAWNAGLARAIDQTGFEYSSEFSYAYDSFPLYPEANNVRLNTLQVPIHPICIGSMRQVGYSEERMAAYFRMVVERKRQRHEPLFFYHHPIHGCWSVVSSLFREVRMKAVDNMTLLEYARWWKRRLLSRPHRISVEGNEIAIQPSDTHHEDVSVRISLVDEKEVIVPLRPRIDLKNLVWEQRREPDPPPEDIRRIREFDPRAALGEMYNRFLRKRT